jgi:hypothetical protein
MKLPRTLIMDRAEDSVPLRCAMLLECEVALNNDQDGPRFEQIGNEAQKH